MARGINPSDPASVAVAAARFVLREQQRCLREGVSFSMETTLSGRSSIELIRTAQRLGWKVRVFYIGLGDPVRNVQRVSSRVLDGGHAVPEADIHRRYWRSLASLPVVADLVDFLAVYDNSGRTLRRVLVIKDRVVHRRQPGSGSTWWEQALAPFLES